MTDADDELRMYRDAVRRFVDAEFDPRQPHWRAQRAPDAADWLAAGRAGQLLPDVPQRWGGGGYAHARVVAEELAGVGVALGAGMQGMVAQYILAYGSDAHKQAWLPRMARGELVAAIAMTEPDLHREAARRRRPVSEPARQRAGHLCG
jgi:acyl-CoA dehydrogenase